MHGLQTRPPQDPVRPVGEIRILPRARRLQIFKNVKFHSVNIMFNPFPKIVSDSPDYGWGLQFVREIPLPFTYLI